MKKILVTILLALFGVINVNAQEIDSLQIKSDTISIESLAARLDKLQHDYDFLYCKYELDRTEKELRLYASDITISANSLMIYLVDGTFNIDLYTSFKNRYDSVTETINAFIDNIVSLKRMISIKKASSGFSEMEILFLSKLDSVVDSQLGVTGSALEHFKTVLDSYKKLK